MLTKEQILALDDLPREEVEIKEWGGTVLLRGMTAGEAVSFKADDENMQVNLIVACAIDANGNHLFTAEDVETLKAKSPYAIGKLFKAALRLNAMGGESQKELEKN